MARVEECIEPALVAADLVNGTPVERSTGGRIQDRDLFFDRQRLVLTLLQHFDEPLAPIELRSRGPVEIAPELRDIIGSLMGGGRLKAVRHVLQGESDDAYMLRDDFNRGIDSLGQFGLAYDILIFERHLPQSIEFVDRHPKQTFVLDHITKPLIRDHVISG